MGFLYLYRIELVETIDTNQDNAHKMLDRINFQ